MSIRDLSKAVLILLFLLGTGLSSSTKAQDSTLIAYYPFNGNAYDTSGFDNHGMVYGAELTSDRFGAMDSAYYFTGDTSYIETQIQDSTFNDYTVSGWYYWEGKDNVNAIGTHDSASPPAGWVMKVFNNKVYYRQSSSLLISDQTVDSEKWYNFTIRYSDSTASLFINGEKESSLEAPSTAGQNIYIGAIPKYLETYNWDGKIDDIRIYNYGLSDSSIYELYIDESSEELPDSSEMISDSLVAYYSFNGDATDKSEYKNDGTVYGASPTKDRFGHPDKAFYFDGNDYIDFGLSEITEFGTSDFSLSVWVNLKISGQDQYQILRKGEDFIQDGTGRWVLSTTGDRRLRLIFEDAQGDSTLILYGENPLEADKWHNITVSYDRDSVLTAYVDNVIEIETDRLKWFAGDLNNGDTYHLLSGRPTSENSKQFFIGAMDDIRIYKEALSDSAVAIIYHEGNWPSTEYIPETLPDTLVAYYPFSGNANDLSGFGQESEVYGAELTFDRFGNPNSAYRFDGLNDFIEVADSPEFKSNALSIDFWFHKDDDEIEESGGFYVEGLLWKSFDTGFDRQFSFSIGNQNSPFDIYNTIGNGTDSLLVNRVKEVIEPGKWYHIAGIIDSSMSHLYINGELVQTVVNEGDIKHNNAPVTIGKASSSSSTNRFFKGSIDDIHIYNFSLSDSAIKNLYLAGGWPETVDTTKAPSDTLLAHYPFNGDSLDHSGYEHHPWIHGATPSEDRFGWADSAFAFDGMDDYMIIPSPDSLHTKKNLSFSFWAKGEANEDSFTGFVSKPNMSPFGIGMDDQNKIIFSITSGDVPLNLVVEENLPDLSKWHHYLAVFRAGEYLRLYVDGEEAGSLYGTIPNYMNTDSADIWIGATLFDSTATDTLYFKGSIDEIRFYNYDLDDQQVLDIYTLESTIPTSTEDLELTPQKYELYQNYPNPFNPSTTIRFDMPAAGDVSLKVYDITGRLISTLIDGRRSAGTHSVILNASGLSSGVYLYQIRTAEYSAVRKFTLIK